MSERPRIERFGRRRPFDLQRGTPKPGRYPPDGLDLAEATEAIAEAPVEIGYGFDHAGRQVFRQVGFSAVLIGFRPEDLRRIRDAVFLHNHPPYRYPEGDIRRRAGSFSMQDLVFMYEQGLREMVVVTKERRYRLSRRPEGFFLDPSQLHHAYAEAAADVREQLRRAVALGQLPVEAAASEGIVADEVMARLAPFFNYHVQQRS